MRPDWKKVKDKPSAIISILNALHQTLTVARVVCLKKAPSNSKNPQGQIQKSARTEMFQKATPLTNEVQIGSEAI